MHCCCVFGCSNKANHSFPRDEKTIKLWEAATRCRVKKHSKICADHIKPEDFCAIGTYSGLKNTRRVTRKGVVPSVFTWSKTDHFKPKERRGKEHAEIEKRKITFPYLTVSKELTNA